MTIYNATIKANIQYLIDIIDIKYTRWSDKNGVKNISYILPKQNLYKESRINKFDILKWQFCQRAIPV